MMVRRRSGLPAARTTDTDLGRALEAMTAPELRAFVRAALDEFEDEQRGRVIDSLMTWRTWGHVARAAGMTWADFADSYPNFVDEWGDEGTLRARWEFPADAVIDVFNEVIGESPAGVAADALSKACPKTLSYPEELVEFSSNYHGESFAQISSIEAAEAFQRFLDSNGLSHIRLVRDDAFMRRLWA